MTKFYTKSGDDGYTGLLGEGRIPKYDPRTEAVGTIDEASAAIGMARSTCKRDQTGSILLEVQRDLYHLMAEVSATAEHASRFRVIDAGRVTWLEGLTDLISDQIEIPKEFILPGDTVPGAALALARTIIRRAERRVVYLLHHNMIENKELVRYLNRLSSLCFVLEIYETQAGGIDKPSLAKE